MSTPESLKNEWEDRTVLPESAKVVFVYNNRDAQPPHTNKDQEIFEDSGAWAWSWCEDDGAMTAEITM